MTITTKYNIGDVIELGGVKHAIVSVHLYESKDKHTERYYLGNKKWITIGKDKENDSQL